MNIPYTCAQPPFKPNEAVEWACLTPEGTTIRVSQNGYCYKAGPFTKEMAEAELARLQAL